MKNPIAWLWASWYSVALMFVGAGLFIYWLNQDWMVIAMMTWGVLCGLWYRSALKKMPAKYPNERSQ